MKPLTAWALEKVTDFKLKLFDKFGWFDKEFNNSEFCNRGTFNYLLNHPQYIVGKIGSSSVFKDYIYWNSSGKEFGTTFPTFYFPRKWINQLKSR